MTKSSLVVLGLTFPLLLAQADPPGATVRTSQPPTRVLLSWTPGEVRCEAGRVLGAPVRRPLNAMIWPTSDGIKPVTYGFRIDASGRPVSITRADENPVRYTEDVGPALAASRFPVGAARQGCEVTYSPSQQPLESARFDDLVSYTMTPKSGALPRAGWDRIRSEGTCSDLPRPQPLMRALPDFRALPATPGVKDWSLVAYDTDATGRPRNISIASGTGNPALDAASSRAMRKSRFTAGARTGCLYPFWRAPGKLPAPPMPEEADFRAADATCTIPRKWATPPTLRFPEPWRQRMIEGWAIVSYDTAPWGEIGNVKVLAAEPAADFGRQAIQVLRSARVVPSPQGTTGCVDRVKFIMGPEDMPPSDEAPAPVY